MTVAAVCRRFAPVDIAAARAPDNNIPISHGEKCALAISSTKTVSDCFSGCPANTNIPAKPTKNLGTRIYP